MATATIQERTLRHARLGHITLGHDVTLEQCSVDTISGLINSTVSITDMTNRPQWVQVECIDPIHIDDSGLPHRMVDCTLFATDAPRIYPHCSHVYGQRLIYTDTWDSDLSLVVEAYGTPVAIRHTHSQVLAQIVQELRSEAKRSLKRGDEHMTAQVAWRTTDGEIGALWISPTDSDPTERDPYVSWQCGFSLDDGWAEMHAQLMTHLDTPATLPDPSPMSADMIELLRILATRFK